MKKMGVREATMNPFINACKKLLDPHYQDLFVRRGNTYEPAHIASLNEHHMSLYTNIGKLAGAAKRMEDLELMPPFLKMLRGQTLDEDDLQHIAPGRDWNFQNIDVEALQLGDAIPVHWPGFPNIADDYPALCGFGKDVTEENVDEYLQWVKESMLKQYEEGIEAQVKYFLRGMQSVST